jgi:hypothetical protein
MKKFLLVLGLLAASPFYVTDLMAQGQENGEEAEQCNICCEGIASGRQAKRSCGHVSCVDCWLKWAKKSDSCPECRAKGGSIEASGGATDLIADRYGSIVGHKLAMAIHFDEIEKFDAIIANLRMLMAEETRGSDYSDLAREELEQGLNYREKNINLPFYFETPYDLAQQSSNPYFREQLDEFINYID